MQVAQSKLLLLANWHADPGARAMALGCLRYVKIPEAQNAALHALHDFPSSVSGSDRISALQQSALQTLAGFPGHNSRVQWRCHLQPIP